LKVALFIARETAQLTLEWFGSRSMEVEYNDDGTPVTEADRAAERHIRKVILEAFPGDGMTGEEYSDVDSETEFRWVINPIDGTKAFIRGIPLYGTHIGIEWSDQTVVGVCVMPALDEYTYAAVGQGAWHSRGGGKPKRARVSQVKTLKQSLLCNSPLRGFETTRSFPVLDSLRGECGMTRGWGECFGHILVATGRAEIAADPLVTPWDCAGLQVIVEEAGGTFTDWSGKRVVSAKSVLSTNGHVLEAALKHTAKMGQKNPD
jgi:histidinol phosphatase-like enzyme (inositol monophosphatase family)